MAPHAGAEKTKPRVVIDTVGFVRSLIKPAGAWGALLTEFSPFYQLVLSEQLAGEIREVFARSRVLRRLAVSAPKAAEHLAGYFDRADWVTLADIPSVSRDPKDDMVIATAIAGKASYLITEDNDLLSLDVVDGVQIVTAARFLSIIRAERQ